MSETFTFTVKFLPGTRVYFADTDGAYLASYHPHIYSDIVESFYLNTNGIIGYHFKNKTGRYSHTRLEHFVFATPKEVVDHLEADIDRQVSAMKAKTRELLDWPIQEGEYGR